jgi:hypothetical protein
VDSLGTVLSIREGLYISQLCLSMCTKGLCMYGPCADPCIIMPFPINSGKLNKGT